MRSAFDRTTATQYVDQTMNLKTMAGGDKTLGTNAQSEAYTQIKNNNSKLAESFGYHDDYPTQTIASINMQSKSFFLIKK